MSSHMPTDDAIALAELQSLMGAVPDGTVFGHPVEREGVTLVPAAKVAFGRGVGKGIKPEGDDAWGHGAGGLATPVGAFVITAGKVEWVPAIDVQRMNLGWQVVSVVGILVGGATIRRVFRRGAWRRS